MNLRGELAIEHNDRTALVTQMLAASRNEAKLALLVSEVPGELKAVEQLLTPQQLAYAVDLSASQIAKLKQSAAKPTASEIKLDRTVGISPTIIDALIVADAHSITMTAVNGNVFDKFNTMVGAEASIGALLKNLSAQHAAIASSYQ